MKTQAEIESKIKELESEKKPWWLKSEREVQILNSKILTLNWVLGNTDGPKKK